MENIGMMEGAFFVSRSDILNWINSTLELNLIKIEQTANGSIALQMMDIMQPGKVPVTKVKWNATQEQEFIHNQKILQKSFDKANIKKWIDVDKLVKAKYQDNLEFMQWLKAYYDRINPDATSYDPLFRRKGVVGAVQKTTHPLSDKTPNENSKKSLKDNSKSDQPNKLKEKDLNAINQPKEKEEEMEGIKSKLESSKTTIGDLKEQLLYSNKERDFYFEKLRLVEEQIEQIEDQIDSSDISSKGFKTIMRILTATGEENLTIDSAELFVDQQKFSHNQDYDDQ